MTAEHSQTPLPKKLGIKPGHTVVLLQAPQGYVAILGSQLQQVRVLQNETPDADVIQFFTASQEELGKRFPELVQILPRHGAIWICWPKKSSGAMTDLTENIVREAGLSAGLVDVKAAAIDELWSGLKFVYRLRDR
ncbi:MAG TPA: hypothetical protein VHA78_03805 [Candidatus Peribacteraceae bacterium]|nr:hypothetical protein [Candidatus Peribacteraceae bacterium]